MAGRKKRKTKATKRRAKRAPRAQRKRAAKRTTRPPGKPGPKADKARWVAGLSSTRRAKIDAAILAQPKRGSETLRHQLGLIGVVGQRAFYYYRATVLAKGRATKGQGQKRVRPSEIDAVIEAAIPELSEMITDPEEKGYVRVSAIRAAADLRRSQHDKERAGLELERVKLQLELQRMQNREATLEIQRRLKKLETKTKSKKLSKADVTKLVDDVLMGRR